MLRPRAVRRFTPTRAGIINLWDYRDEEFLFVDGWLVLRGPNGSGKTKALEVLFPFVLDGRIEPRRLNPFASEDRTMKSNLLYRGQEVAHAYAWMELSDGDTHVTIGIGLRAHRHVDRVSRWHFVVDGRVGVDFSLLDVDDRPLNKRDLVAHLGQDAVCESTEEYRRVVDARLFGLGPARYEQMLDLVLTLRKPQLAKDLNPVELSRTLQRGLRPIDEHLLVEAAGSFDDMEAVARTLEGLVAADTATTAFLSVYSTYLRTHARAAADALTARRAAAGQRQDELERSRQALAGARDAEEAAQTRLLAAEETPARLRAHLGSLKSSAAYQSHEQLADLERHVHDLALEARRRGEAVAVEQGALARRRAEWQRAELAVRDAQASVRRLAGELAHDAEAAGIGWSGPDAEWADLPARISARVSGRRDDVRAVREQANRVAQAERDHTRAAADMTAAAAAAGDAQRLAARAEESVAAARDHTRAELDRWAIEHDEPIRALTVTDLPARLAATVDRAGEASAQTLKEVYADATAPDVAGQREALFGLRARRDELLDRRAEVSAERARIAAEHDDAPLALATRPAARTERPGAPLWRLVRFADGVLSPEAARIEAALHAAGLLDAWIHPTGEATASALRSGEQDGYLVPLAPQRRPAGRTLADILIAEDQDDVPGDRVGAVLGSIALADVLTPETSGAPAVSSRGQYAQGVSLGSHAKPAPEYIGATARAARRAARIAECDRELSTLDGEIAAAESELASVGQMLAAVAAAGAALPTLAPILAALRELDRAAATLRARQEAATAAAARLDQAIAEQAAASAALRRVGAERRLSAERVDEVAAATGRFEQVGLRLDAAYTAAARAVEAGQEASLRQDEATERLGQAEATARDAGRRHQEKNEAYQALRSAIGEEADRVLAQAAQVEDEIAAAETALAQAQESVAAAREGHAGARIRVELGEQVLSDAVAEAHQEALRLRPYAQPDLLVLLRCPDHLRWPAQTASEAPLAPEIIALHEAIVAATRELSPTETSLKQSATRLTTALTELQAQLPAAGLDHRPEWDTDGGVIVVRVADEQGLTPVAHFAERITRERRDQEQLLTEAEQRVFEDALLGQLARQIHQRTIGARDLVESMDGQMRARRMSSGMTVGVGWRLADDLDPEQRDVCKMLERDPARLGPAQLATLRRHFAARIKTARAGAPEQPYRDLLAQVLDYRQWRVFAFTLHRPGGGTEPLTRARHSQLSGGEQSVSLHLPLFAAANALFSSARPDAPRLLGLDEAFAGVDDNGRAELMSLARQFDLDLFMTGYDLWATHPTVGGAAHYDLSHAAVDHAVSTVLLVWDGSANIVDFDGTLARALGSPETRRVPGAGPAADSPAMLMLDPADG